MITKVWLDDVRTPPDSSWTWAQSFSQFRWIINNQCEDGQIKVISFDHDLGPVDHSLGIAKDGYDCLKWLASVRPNRYPQQVLVHSANPVGAERIRDYDEFFRNNREEF